MRRICLLILIILAVFSGKAFAFNIVYPKKQNVNINSKSTFFIGSSKKPITVNGQNIPLHESGAFAYVVDLKVGQNTFKIVSEDECKIYTITRPNIKSYGNFAQPFKQYDNIKSFYVTSDNAPLRSTPIDAGINRIAHLQRNVLLNVDGEKNGFYRIVLSNNKYAWISKSSVKACENYVNAPAIIKEISEENTNGSHRFVFRMNKMVPFEIIEGEPMILKLYNIDGAPDGVYTKEFSLTENFGIEKHVGYGGKYIGTDFVWEIREPLKVHQRHPLKNINIAIDAGHGGYETGAIGCLGDNEKDINLAIAKILEKELTKRGANVIMIRDEDYYIGLKERVDIANYADSTIFISIHANALPDGLDPNEHSGTSIYYYYDQAKPLAETLINTMVTELNINNDGVRQASFAVVRNTEALSVLIEVAYLINPDDNAKLIDVEFQKKCAKSIANGLEDYLLNNK